MSSGFRFDSCRSAFSLDPSRRAVVERALRATKEAIVSFFRPYVEKGMSRVWVDAEGRASRGLMMILGFGSSNSRMMERSSNVRSK